MSLENKYVFLSNPKCASTQIERTYANSVELPLLTGSKFGNHPTSGAPLKHTDYRDFCKNFDMFFRHVVPRNRFFVFGIARDPIRRLRSYYTFMTRDNSPIKGLYAGLSFEDYLDIIASNRAKQYKPHFIPSNQAEFFSDHERIRVNYICKLENLEDSFDRIKSETGLEFHDALDGSWNANKYQDDSTISSDIKSALRKQMADEYDMYDNFTDRMLVMPVNWKEQKIEPDQTLKWMLEHHNPYEVAASIVYNIQQKLRSDREMTLMDYVY